MFEQALGVVEGQGSLVCCSPWDRKESDMTKQLNWTEGIFKMFKTVHLKPGCIMDLYTFNVLLFLFLKWCHENCPRKYIDFIDLSVTNQVNMFWCCFPDSVQCGIFSPIINVLWSFFLSVVVHSFKTFNCNEFLKTHGAFLYCSHRPFLDIKSHSCGPYIFTLDKIV